ncbi:PREDICTED: uncharacterized protein LOC105556458 [Vollenhovia emeryi]|uniref:uncharacterized protein LOC105556458 n=1 Tax=Vollenhovia emeryi TaxID=411798 RepID=UPI0005F54010|nr:PREDICTED: uncharacterized protein LOC105556458 [Vollenhovia emeryi]
MANIRSRINLQESRFALIQRAAEDATDDYPVSNNRSLINTRLEVLESNWSRFQSEHDSIYQGDIEFSYDEPYFKNKPTRNLETSNPTSRSSDTLPNVSFSRRSALPKITLPRFSGDYPSWRPFHDLFSSMVVNNPELTNVEKMQYLKTCLNGEAARLITNLPVSGDTFTIAWEALIVRYENKRLLISSQLDKLFSIKPLKTKSARSLSLLHATVTESLGALRALGCAVDHWDPILLYQLPRLLDSDTREVWEIKLGSSTAFPRLVQFEDFLIGRTRALESLEGHSSKLSHGKERPYGFSSKPEQARTLLATTKTAGGMTCRICGSTHYVSSCPDYSTLSIQRRREEVNKLKLCYNCLGNHTSKQCPSTQRCRKCGKKHHTSLHLNDSHKITMSNNDKFIHVELSSSSRPSVLLATCQARISRKVGRLESIRLLIDPGSELSFVSEDVVQRLALTRKPASITLLGIGVTHAGRTRGVVTLHLKSLHDMSSGCTIQAYILPRLTTKLPTFDVATSSLTCFNGLQLADPDYGRPGPIHIIIGSDFYGQVIKPNLIRGDSPSSLAQLTVFGWALSGPVSTINDFPSASGYHCSIDHQLHDLLSKFWKQEEVHCPTESSLNPDDANCEAHYKSTHSRDDTGRYIVRLPLKSPASSLGDSTKTALRSLTRLCRRLETDTTYNKRYSDFIQEYESLGHMTLVPTSEINASPTFYLPHHGVLREQSRTTKLRVVFNGSSRTNTGMSLNDILYPGAKLQSEISDVLLWVRLHKYIFSTDIVKMFRQIKMHPNDWDLQRIFWQDSNKDIISYRLTTVTYGLSCAPFLALRTLNQLVEDEGHRFPLAVPPLTRGRYVDDIFGGAGTIIEAKAIVEQLIELCKAGGFPLQKWSSNNPELLKLFPKTFSDTTTPVEIESSTIKILGLCWQPSTDTYQFTSWPTTERKITKRTVLSEIAQLFDPLGLISPIVIRAKLFIQELWISKLGWDDSLSPDLQYRWNTFRQQLPELNRLHIPRWLQTSPTVQSVELHGFSDASNLAMAAVVFIRIIDSTGNISTNLVCSKTRVAPLKRLTIPRLELTAALMLARLIYHVQKALEMPDIPIFLWTDSSVTLSWISSHPSRWKDFIRNRVAAIQEITPFATWRFISGKQNPADCASRGIDATQLEHHSLWWKGPPWLSKTTTEWPSGFPGRAPEADLELKLSLEERSGSSLITLQNPNHHTGIYLIVARFRRTSIEPICTPLTPAELQQSSHFWAQQVQHSCFSHEIKILSEGAQLTKSNPIIRLTPYIDRSGLLREEEHQFDLLSYAVYDVYGIEGYEHNS